MHRLIAPLAASLLLAASLPAQTAPAVPPAPTAAPRPLPQPITDRLGRYLVIQVVGTTPTQALSDAIAECSKRAPERAGVRHVFVSTAEPPAVAPAGTGEPLVETLADTGGAIADHFNATGAPVAVILDPEGREIARVASADAAPPRFDAVRDRLDGAWKIDTTHHNLPKRETLAIGGYDPVAYDTLSKAVRGDAAIESQHRGVRYRFSTAEHRRLFAADPERYLPTYGGWCATAIAKGDKVEIDPTSFKRTDGRLFLFYKGFFADARKDWLRDEARNQTEADRHWRDIIGQRR